LKDWLFVATSKPSSPPLADLPETARHLVSDIVRGALQTILGETPGSQPPLQQCWLQSVWGCLHFHSQRSGRDFQATAQCLAQNRLPTGPQTSHPVSSNVLHDVMLTRLVEAGHEPAILLFRSTYAGHLASLAGKFPGLLADSSPHNTTPTGLMDTFLSEAARKAIRLSLYSGSAPLGAWILQVAGNHFTRRSSRRGGDSERRAGAAPEETLPGLPDRNSAHAHCQHLVRSILMDSVLNCRPPLTERELLVLRMRIVNQWSNKEVALELGIHPGVASRDYTHAVKKLAETTQLLLAKASATDPRAENCIQQIFADSGFKELAEVLRNLIDVPGSF
jgi:DNA-directed RNA polymerase specialized sigma24 family protein